MHSLREPGAALIEQFVNVDRHRTMALVAVIDKAAPSASSASRVTPRTTTASVNSPWRWRIVAMPRRRQHADSAAVRPRRAAGLSHNLRPVLTDNQRMVELAEWLGLTVDPVRRGETTVRAWRRLV